VIEHCPPPSSEMMAFWVGVSKSVAEGTFGEWVRELMGVREGSCGLEERVVEATTI